MITVYFADITASLQSRMESLNARVCHKIPALQVGQKIKDGDAGGCLERFLRTDVTSCRPRASFIVDGISARVRNISLSGCSNVGSFGDRQLQ